MGKKMTHEEFINKIEEKYPGRYEIISKYTGNKDPITFKCNWCGSIVTLKQALNLNGRKCKECYKIKIDNFKSLLEDKGYSIIDSSNFKDSKSKILIKHNKCGYEYKCSYNNFQQNRECPKCANEKRVSIIAPNIENYLDGLLEKSLDGKEYRWEENYNHNNKEKLLITHLNCGNSYKVRPNDFQQGYRCPFCSNSNYLPCKSKMWHVINSYLKDKGNLEYEFKNENCKNKRPLPFDFKFNNTIIEYDGSQHFITKNSSFIREEKIEVTKKNDEIKNKFIIGTEFNFVRFHYKLKENQIIEILEYIVNDELIPDSLIDKYKILVKQSNRIYNYREYYENFNDCCQ